MTRGREAEIKVSEPKKRAELHFAEKCRDAMDTSTLWDEDLQDLAPEGCVTVNGKWPVLEPYLTAIILSALLSLVLLISVTICAAYSQDNNTSIRSGAVSGRLLKTIIVPDYYPYTFVNDQGIPDGFSVDLAKAVVQAMDMKMEIGVDTWERAREALEKGTIDFLPMTAASPVRRQVFDFSVSHTVAYDAVFVRKGTHHISSLEDLAGKTVIVMNRDAAHDFVLGTSLSDKIKLEVVDSLPDGLRLLASGRGDAAIMPKLVGILLCRKLNISNIDESPVTIESYNRPFGFAVKKGRKELLEALNQGLSIVDSNGRYREIYDKWFGILSPPGVPWKSVVKYIAVIVAVSAFLGMVPLVWSLSLRKMVAQRTMLLESEIQERKKSQEALREETEFTETVLNSQRDSFVLFDLATGKLIRWNKAFKVITGYSDEEIAAMPVPDSYCRSEDLERAHICMQETLKTGTAQVELELICKDGRKVPTEYDASVVEDVYGTPNYIVCIGRDITERKKAEEALRESEARYRGVFENAAIGIDVVDSRGRFLQVNRSLTEMLGYTEDELLNRTIFDISHHDDVEESRIKYEKMVNGEIESYRFEKRYVRKDGKFLWADVSASPIRTPDGVHVATIGVIADITGRKRTEEALFQAKQDWEDTFNSIEDMITIHDKEFNIVAHNKAAHEILRLPDLVTPGGIRCYQYYHGLSCPPENCPSCRCIETRKPTTFETFEPHLNMFIELRAIPRFDRNGDLTGLIHIFRDITDRKKAAEALRESEERYRTLFEKSMDGVYSVLRDGQITGANPSFVILFGYTQEEMIGKDIRELYADPADRPKFQEQIEKCGFVKDYEVKFRKKDGTEVDCLLTSSVHFSEDGGIVGYRGIVRDLTLRKELQKQLFQAQKMEAVGTLAGGVAHDFNNILQVALGYSELMMADEGLPDCYRADVKKINDSARRGADLVKQLLTFSRKTDIAPRPLNLNQCVRDLRKMIERTIPKMIDIQLLLNGNIARVNADPTQIDQILMNLAVNARDAMPDGGKLIFETADAVLDEEFARNNIGVTPGHYVLLTVTDNGSGMEKDRLQHIFEPFYTTKAVGEGTGLGLAMVHGIVKQHGGHIRCFSEPGEGTTFKIYLPALLADAEPTETAVTVMPRGGDETILIADDEGLIRELGSRILSKAGYKVIAVSNGKEALDVHQQRGDEIALTILDIIMPEMGGMQCLERLLQTNPKVKVLISSGYASGGLKDNAIAHGARGFVGKPFVMGQLLTTVRDIIDQ